MTQDERDLLKKLTNQLNKSSGMLKRTSDRLEQQDEIIKNLIDTIKDIAHKNHCLTQNAALELTRGSLKQCHN
jgi:archaellum component FlaC